MQLASDLSARQGRPRYGRIQHASQNLDRLNFGFGGIRARYRDFPGRVLRAIDPFSIELVHFGSPLQYENWLLRRFEPSIVFLDYRRDEWSVLHHGKLLKVNPHLHWAGWAMKGYLEMVAEPGKELAPRVLETLDIVARAHGLVPSVRTADRIRACPGLLDLLDRARQLTTLHMREVRDSSLRHRVLSGLRSNPRVSRKGLLDELGTGSNELSAPTVDAILFWLRQTAAVRFDLDGGRYGDQTVIEAA